MGVAEPPPWAMGVVQPPPGQMGVARPPRRLLGVILATPIFFLGVVEPSNHLQWLCRLLRGVDVNFYQFLDENWTEVSSLSSVINELLFNISDTK
jgi:hypothetical protein